MRLSPTLITGLMKCHLESGLSNLQRVTFAMLTSGVRLTPPLWWHTAHTCLVRSWHGYFNRLSAFAGTCVSPVERSLIYCMKHPMRKNVVPHKKPLFSEWLLHNWRVHYCKHYPDLQSSKEYFADAYVKVGTS
jgi:hypothetical protein